MICILCCMRKRGSGEYFEKCGLYRTARPRKTCNPGTRYWITRKRQNERYYYNNIIMTTNYKCVKHEYKSLFFRTFNY